MACLGECSCSRGTDVPAATTTTFGHAEVLLAPHYGPRGTERDRYASHAWLNSHLAAANVAAVEEDAGGSIAWVGARNRG